MSQCLYFLKSGGKIKIGVTRNIHGRVAAIQINTVGRLKILALIQGWLPLERKLHRELAEYRLTGEWFSDCLPVREAMAKCMADFGPASTEPRKLVKIKNNKFPAVARTLWPNKTSSALSKIAGTDIRTAKRWLRGESDPPISVILAIIGEMATSNSICGEAA